MNGQYRIGETVLGSWVIKKKLGEGSFGRVYEIEREDFGERYRAALKIITVPQSEAELRGAQEEGMDPQSAEQYFYSVVQDIVREFALMARLKGTAHVVSYEDHTVIRHQNGIGWDILIRMELLTPLLTYAYAHPFSRREIMRMGIDLCQALELCQKYNIIHRDIKPENIFVSDNGDFKLGDFGIARTVEKTMSGLSKKGTYNYMAPEVYRGAEYGFSVDIYSLGIVLYRMLNKNRVPFLPPAPEPITYSARESALAHRMGGDQISKPFYAQGRLAEIVEKAVAFQPKERYPSPMQMRQELEAILYEKEDAEIIYPDGDELALAENLYASKTPVREAEALPAEQTSATSSMFGSVAATVTAKLEDGTESFFKKISPVNGDGTAKTQSVFSRSAAKRKAPAQTDRRAKKAWPLVLTAAAVVALSAGGAFYLKSQQIRQQEARQASYQSLMVQASGLYESDPQQAGARLLDAQKLFPKESEPYIGYAYALYCDRQYEKCVNYIENDLALGKSYELSTQSRLSEILGAAYFEKGDYAASASFFRLSTAGGDITVSAMRDYAVALGRLGDIIASEKVLQKMFDSGADETVTKYVQAEVDYAQKEYLNAEQGFRAIYDSAKDTDLKKRAMRSLAEVYRDCAALEKLGKSPIVNAAACEAELLSKAVTELSLNNDSTIWEMLAQAYFDAYQMNHKLGDTWLKQSAQAFEHVLELGIHKDYLYSNLFIVYYQQGDYTMAENALSRMEQAYSKSYTPHALRCMMLITIENNKTQSNRDYDAAYQEFEKAQGLLTGSDDRTYFQQIETLIKSLKAEGWL